VWVRAVSGNAEVEIVNEAISIGSDTFARAEIKSWEPRDYVFK